MAKNPNHEFDVKMGKHHTVLGDTEGGKCLTRCSTAVNKKENSCWHPWQAWKRAVANDSRWYNSYAQSARKVFDPPPPPGTWHLGYQRNFRVNAKTPYRHNSHHIIPNGLLNDCIEDVVEQVAQSGGDGPTFRKLLRGGLLDAEYNLNHMVNMIILPRGRRVALVLQLPAHLEKGAQSHEQYDASVLPKVIDVIMDFAATISKKEDHPSAPKKKSKKKLEALSGRLRRAIRAWGVQQSELLLDRIPPSHFTKFD